MSVVGDTYYQGFNEHLFKLVPAAAKRILEIGCAEGNLGAALKLQSPDRVVYGVEYVKAAAEKAAARLDQVFNIDVERDELPIEAGSIDCILYGDVLEHLTDPGAVLDKHRRLLAPNGTIVCSIPNIQHHSIITSLFRGDFHYTSQGLLDRTHLRFFTAASFTKLLLDAGFVPVMETIVHIPAGKPFFRSVASLIRFVGTERHRLQRNMEAFQYVYSAKLRPNNANSADCGVPMTFVVNVTDEAVFEANLMASPCLASGEGHELIVMRRQASEQAAAYNAGFDQASNELVVFVHQDVYLPKGWPVQCADALRIAEQMFGNVEVAGVSGTSTAANGAVEQIGRLLESDALVGTPVGTARQAESLHDCLVMLKKSTRLRFDERLGRHFLGADLCLQARQLGKAGVVLEALCYHNNTVDVPDSGYWSAGTRFARKWAAELPVATAYGMITAAWKRPSLKATRVHATLTSWWQRIKGALRAP